MDWSMYPVVTVIIPAKNEEICLAKSLPAVRLALAEWGGVGEIILVDNGSTDGTVTLAEKYGCKVMEIPHGNISHLRNVGAENAQGTILAFLDADCVVSRLWFSLCLRHFQNEQIAAVGTPAVPDSINPTWVESAWDVLMPSCKRPEFVNWLGTSNLFIDKIVFNAVGGFDESLSVAEDVDLCRRIRAREKLVYLEQKTTTVHLRESKTLKELFKRELWRGGSSLRVFHKSNFPLADIPSVLIPAVNVLAIISLLPLFIFYSNESIWFPLLMIFLFPLMLLFKKRVGFDFDVPALYLHCYLISFTYILARSCSLILEIVQLSKRQR